MPRETTLKSSSALSIAAVVLVLYASWARAGTYSGGTGEPNDPYLIYDANQINAIGASPNDWDKHFKLMESIDLSGYPGNNFNIIGDNSKAFSGVFDGDGHVISNLYYSESSCIRDNVGLFGYVKGVNAQIKNLGRKNVYIDHCTHGRLGGLVGYLKSGEIVDCYVEDVNLLETYSGGDVGGLVGKNEGVIKKCKVTGIIDGYSFEGGLVAVNWGDIYNSYAIVDTKDEYIPYRGGLVAANISGSQIVNCYSAGYVYRGSHDAGGLVGYNNGVVSNSFWDIETSEIDHSAGGVGKTTVQMQMQSTFTSAGWDFATPVWKMPCEGCDYPRLWYEDAICIATDQNLIEFEAYLDGATPESQTLLIHNCVEGELNWIISEVNDCNWLNVWPLSGTSTEDYNEITLTVDIAGLKTGIYTYELTISDPNAENSPYTLPVKLNILGPELWVSSNEFNFQASKETLVPTEQILQIQNKGYLDLEWSIERLNDCNWLNVEPISGVVSSDTNDVNEVILSIDVNSLNYGFYSCQLTISDEDANNSPQIVAVNLDVLRPTISIVPGNMDFEAEKDGADPNAQILSIQNTGYDTLNWQISVTAGCDWLSVDLLNGQSTGEVDEVALSVDDTDLDFGFYDCELTVTALDADNSPQIVPVSLHVYTEGQRHVPAEYGTIQAAIDAAVDGDEVIIQPGTYTGQGNYNIDFKGKAITVRSIEPENPSIVAATIIDPESGWHRAFYFHNEEDPNSVLAGLTIINCYGSGAIYCYQSSPTVSNCVVRECLGRGISLILSNAIIHNCTIINTMPANLDGSVVGTGIYCGGSNPLISNCTISNNFYGGLQCVGSYLTVINSLFTGNKGYSFIHSYFPPFDDTSYGGGIIFQGGNIDVTNCTFSSNVADVGGAICSYGAYQNNTNNMTINNCIFWENDANEGPQIAIENYVGQIPAVVAISYSDVQGGQSAVYVDPCCTLEWDDGNNLDIDPCFAEPGYWHPNDTPLDANDDFWVNGDYHLKSQTGRWKPSIYIGLDPTGDGFIDLSDFVAFANSWQKKGGFIPADLERSGIVDLSDLKLLLENYLADYPVGEWVIDNVTSPCIDAGDPNSDWTVELWPHGKRTNMGAYGGTVEASMSPSSMGCVADTVAFGAVNFVDFARFAAFWQAEQSLLPEDYNRDGKVDSIDLGILAEWWLWEE